MDAQDAQDFFWRWQACSPGHPQIRTRSSPESAYRATASHADYPVHPCSIRNSSRSSSKSDGIRAHPGARASRPHALAFGAAQFPCDTAPARPAGGKHMSPPKAEPSRRCRSIPVEELGKALPVLCGRDARAPGWGCSAGHRHRRHGLPRSWPAKIIARRAPN